MWNLNFITRENLKQHIKNTISTYEKTLDGIDLSKFNSNIVDPIKMVFDSKVYRKDFEEVIGSLIERPPGKLKLVPDDDKRLEIKNSAEIDFKN